MVRNKNKSIKISVRKTQVLYLTYNFEQKNQAQHLNSSRRVAVLEKLGFKVVTHNINPSFTSKLQLIDLVSKTDILYIRIDGSGCLDKYSFLKLLYPHCKVIWEIHGSQEEKIFDLDQKNGIAQIKINNLKRKFFSLFVNSYIFVSDEVKKFCFNNNSLLNRQSFVIENFLTNDSTIKKNPQEKIFNSKLFKVIWIGNPAFKWHGIDIIEAVAKKVYSLDKKVLFILTGGESWHEIKWQQNIVFTDQLDGPQLNRYISESDLCLAIYKKNNFFPRYFFPLKILNYLQNKKTVIASNSDTISKIINDGDNGFLTNNSVSDLVTKIIKLKKNPTLRKKVGNNGYKTLVNRYSENIALKKYKAVFNL